ncbi:hypothetical protein B0H34DRAFT_687850 [Crassisporium funariophilum]|nr:hypothetical protein B0H34DRAFT_687850 [Crassisporium funariophilum]
MPTISLPGSVATSLSASLPLSHNPTPMQSTIESPQKWESTTNNSYESSILQPSSSVLSIALQEADTSFETSFMRPSGSASSWDRMSTIPPFPPQSPLSPVPALPPSISSATDVTTPTSFSLSSGSSSSLGRTLSQYSNSSFGSQSSLSSSVLHSGSLLDFESEPAPERLEVILQPSTEPSLLSRITATLPLSSRTPTPPKSYMETPEASLIVSLTTPRGSDATVPSTWRTVPSQSTVTVRDLGRDLDKLADAIRSYDHARRLESQDVAENVKALRVELRDLADFLRGATRR